MRRTHVARAILGTGIAAAAIALATAGLSASPTFGLGGGAVAYGSPSPQAKPKAKPQRAFAAMPLAFVQNRGQTDARVRYYALGNHYAFFATRDELMLSLTKDKPARSLALGLRFIGRNPHVAIAGAKGAPGKVNYLTGHRSRGLAHEPQPLPGGRLPRVVAAHRPAAARAGRRLEVRVPPASRGAPLGHQACLCRRAQPQRSRGPAHCGSRRASACCRDAPPVSYQVISGKRVSVRSRYVLEVRAPEQGAEVRVRGRGLPPGPRSDHRSRHPVHDVPRRQQPRDRSRHRGRRERQFLYRRHDPVAELPDDRGRLQAHRSGRATSRTSSSRSSTRREPRWSTRRSSAAATSSSGTASPSTEPATRTSRARRSRRISRRRAAPSTAASTSRPTARAAALTSPTASSSS